MLTQRKKGTKYNLNWKMNDNPERIDMLKNIIGVVFKEGTLDTIEL